MTASTNGTHQTLAPPADTGRVLKLPTDRFRFCPTNPPGRLDDVDDLRASIGQLGQQVPGISYPDPERPDCYIVADGNRRLMALRILALPFLTIILDHEPSKKELRRIRLSLNNAHKHMTPDQVADEISEHIQEENCSQEDAAEYFGISCGYVSKLLAPSKRLIAELRPLVGKPGISRDVLRVIAGMPTPEQQKQLAEQVLADVAREGRAKRDAVIRYADKLKGDKKPRKGTPLTLKADGIELKITKPLQEGIRAFLERVAGAMKKLKGDEDLHTALPFYFRSA